MWRKKTHTFQYHYYYYCYLNETTIALSKGIKERSNIKKNGTNNKTTWAHDLNTKFSLLLFHFCKKKKKICKTETFLLIKYKSNYDLFFFSSKLPMQK